MSTNTLRGELVKFSSCDEIVKRALHSIELDSTITGQSMQPLITTSGKLKLKYVNPALLQIGDIIGFEDDGKIALHRLVGKKFAGKKLFFLTKGDNQFFFDEWIESERVIGKLVELNGLRLNKFPFPQTNRFIAFFSFFQGLFAEFFLKSLSRKKYFSRKNTLWKKILRTFILIATNPLLLIIRKNKSA